MLNEGKWSRPVVEVHKKRGYSKPMGQVALAVSFIDHQRIYIVSPGR